MLRFLLIAGALLGLGLMLRRALRPPRPDDDPKQLAPKGIVCGACGLAYDPARSGFECPQCKQ